MPRNHSAPRCRLSPPTPASLLLAMLMTSAAAPVGLPAGSASDALAVRVTPAVVLAEQDVKALVTVPRRPDNRRLVVTVEGPSYYASTERQLDGEGAARMHEFAFRQLPEGDYVVLVSVEGTGGPDAAIDARFTVRGVPLDAPSTTGAMP